MEIRSFFGVPAHPLVVHVPVVFVPLAFLGAVLIIASPRARAHLAWVVAAFAAIGAAGAIAAASTGETLESQVDKTPALHDHVALGESARLLAFIFFVAVAAYVVVERLVARKQSEKPVPERLRKLAVPSLVTPLAALMILTGAAAFVRIAQAGHQGAKVSWSELESSTASR